MNEILTLKMWKRLERVIRPHIHMHESKCEINIEGNRIVGYKKIQAFFHVKNNGMITAYWTKEKNGSLRLMDGRNKVYKVYDFFPDVANRISLFEKTLEKWPENFNDELKHFVEGDIYIDM